MNPHRRLSPFIKELTGIRQQDLDSAPGFEAIATRLVEFMRGATPIAHNASFDFGFLRVNGVAVGSEVCDTWELAYLAMPSAKSYGLEYLARTLSVTPERVHRALDDARAVRDVFLALIREFAGLDSAVIGEFRRLARGTDWNIGTLLDSAMEFAESRLESPRSTAVGGVDTRALSRRLARPRPIAHSEERDAVDRELVCSALSSRHPASASVPDFEEREQQIDMAAAVVDTINAGGRLIVEAGTGVGKSLAYLLPAAMFATANDRRVVVSTNTINLQEQLIEKDLPVVKKALAAIDPELAEKFRYTQLKGRANYLCFRRWRQANSSADLDGRVARLVGKTLTWIPETGTGDRSELNLGHPQAASAWDRLSAQRAQECPSVTGPCFLRAAREDAAASHVVVVNHALLLSDLAAGGSAIPDYDVLIIDEAHHLEAEATRQLGFEVGPNEFSDLFAELTGERGLLSQTESAARRAGDAEERTRTVDEITTASFEMIPRLRSEIAELFRAVASSNSPSDFQNARFAMEQLVDAVAREVSEWKLVESSWQNVDILMADLSRRLGELEKVVDAMDPDSSPGLESLSADLASIRQQTDLIRERAREVLAQPSGDTIYWTRQPLNSSDSILNSAPLHVGEQLGSMLYSSRHAVIMTSATLSVAGSFDHTVERLGFAGASELVLGSPFDFYESALLYTPPGMPQPGAHDFHKHVARVVMEAAGAADGRTMVLFTSRAALNETAGAIRGPLSNRGIDVIAQGRDGPPRVVAERFVQEPRSVLLGTSSFWEGVDFSGDSLTVLIVARLPFQVPSDPVFKARSQQYDNAFMEYALPNAIIRFRQGFGRLIRSTRDRGVAIVLDPRILTQRYGREFIAALPRMRVTDGRGHGTANLINKWMERSE